MIEHLETWANGEKRQGIVMTIMGSLLMVGFLLKFDNTDDFHRGLFTPLALVFLIFFGYGVYMIYSRPKRLRDVKNDFRTDESKTIGMERARLLKDLKNYTRLVKFVWPLLIFAGVLAFYFVTNRLHEGIGFGVFILGLVGFAVDFALRKRTGEYYLKIKE